MDWIASILSRHPDGDAIRNLSDLPIFGDTGNGGVRWHVQVLRKDELLTYGLNLATKPVVIDEDDKILDLAPLSEEDQIRDWEVEIDRRLSWRYPEAAKLNMPFKLSVSDMKRASKGELAGANVHIPALIPKPKFMDTERKKNSAEIGTLHHFVMQHLNLKEALSPDGIKAQLNQMVMKNLIDQEDAKLVNTSNISRFFDTPLGVRMLKSDHIHREVPFILNKNMDGVDIMIQGIIDCYFEESDGVVILDYKTDFTGISGTDAVAENYRVQVELYTEALTRLLEKPVKGAFIYFFDAGESIQI